MNPLQIKEIFFFMYHCVPLGIPGDSVALSSSYYKNINRLLPNKSPEDSEAYINSKVLAMSVLGLESGSKLDPPIQLDFVQNKVNITVTHLMYTLYLYALSLGFYLLLVIVTLVA